MQRSVFSLHWEEREGNVPQLIQNRKKSLHSNQVEIVKADMLKIIHSSSFSFTPQKHQGGIFWVFVPFEQTLLRWGISSAIPGLLSFVTVYIVSPS